MRQKSDYNSNPVRLFNTIFRTLAVTKLLRPPAESNCQLDNDVLLEDTICGPHRNYVMKKLIVLRIYNECKWA